MFHKIGLLVGIVNSLDWINPYGKNYVYINSKKQYYRTSFLHQSQGEKGKVIKELRYKYHEINDPSILAINKNVNKSLSEFLEEDLPLLKVYVYTASHHEKKTIQINPLYANFSLNILPLLLTKSEGNIRQVVRMHKTLNTKFNMKHFFEEYLMNHYMIESYKLSANYDFNTAFRIHTIDKISGHRHGPHGILRSLSETNQNKGRFGEFYRQIRNAGSLRDIKNLAKSYQ